MFICDIFNIKLHYPLIQLSFDFYRVMDSQSSFGKITGHMFRRLKVRHNVLKFGVQQIDRLCRRIRGRYSPNPTMGLIAIGMPISIILMTGNRIVPVNYIHCSVWPNLNIDRSEISV